MPLYKRPKTCPYLLDHLGRKHPLSLDGNAELQMKRVQKTSLSFSGNEQLQMKRFLQRVLDHVLIRNATASSLDEASPAAAINESTGPRVAETGAIWRELQQVMLQYELSTCHYVGPFVDEVRCVGHAAIFEKSTKY